jgi:carboxyl-terminal processing protease
VSARNLNIIVLTFLFCAFCYVAHRRTVTALHVGDALNLINTYYVDPIDEGDLLNAAMDGMTSKLDEHSEYIPVQEFETFQDNISQEFAGIGIFVEQPDEGQPVRVITPLVGSPALSAGILPGDKFIRVGDEDVSSMGLREVSKRLKGPVGTIVNVTVQRDDQQVEMDIQRATIELESVIGTRRDDQNHWIYRLPDDPSIAYIRLTGFGEKTVEELREVLIDLNNDFSALIFDLRGNGGGLLESAIEVSDMFIDKGEIVLTRTRGGALEDRYSSTTGTLVATDKPLAILIDGNSASASEIVAACLQDNGRASIVGERSYGKGTVQNVMPLQYGRSALRLTVARFYRPSGENLHRAKDAPEDQPWGVRPGDGLEVALDDETRKQLEKLWARASYPSLAGAADKVLDSESTTEPEAAADPGDPAVEAKDELLVDPQLQRAAEHLRTPIPAKTAQPAAA